MRHSFIPHITHSALLAALFFHYGRLKVFDFEQLKKVHMFLFLVNKCSLYVIWKTAFFNWYRFFTTFSHPNMQSFYMCFLMKCMTYCLKFFFQLSSFFRFSALWNGRIFITFSIIFLQLSFFYVTPSWPYSSFLSFFSVSRILKYYLYDFSSRLCIPYSSGILDFLSSIFSAVVTSVAHFCNSAFTSFHDSN